MTRLLPFIITLLLTACGTVAYHASDLPTLAIGQTHWFKLEHLDQHGQTLQTSLLAIQGAANGQSRWVQTDAFGAPQARLIATKQGWQRDGFIMPNRAAEKLFTHIMPALRDGLTQPKTIDNWRISPLEQP